MKATVWMAVCVALVGACSLVTTVPNLTGGLELGDGGDSGASASTPETGNLETGPITETGASTSDTGSSPNQDGGADTSARDSEAGPSGDESPVGSDANTGDAGPINCGDLQADAGIFICETFENGLDAGFWASSVEGSGSTVAIDLVNAHRGSHSLHAHVDPAANDASVDAGQAEALLSHYGSLPSSAYARLFVYQAGPAPNNYDVFMFFNMSMSPYGGVGLGLDSAAALKFQDWYQQPKYVEAGSEPVPINHWFCVTWQVSPNSTVSHTNASNVLVNDFSVPLAVPDLSQTFVGLLSLVPIAAPIDLWIDDIIVADSPILCSD